MIIKHKFVKHIPDVLVNGTIYISMEFGTAIHKCCCGCGEEVVTPFSPTDWEISYNGETVSLYPSIGNWSFKCQSHYWITNSKVTWAKVWSKQRIEAGRKQDVLNKQNYYKTQESTSVDEDKKESYINLLFSKVKKLFLKKDN